MSEKKNEGHSSYSVWLVYSFRAIEKIVPALKGRQKWGWVAPFALCFVVLLGLIGFGIYFDGYVLHPPRQYTGICTPPAEIKGPNCVLVQTQAVTVSGSVTIVTHTAQAGTILNASKG